MVPKILQMHLLLQPPSKLYTVQRKLERMANLGENPEKIKKRSEIR